MGPGMPPHWAHNFDNNRNKEPLPKNILEIPAYLKRVTLKFLKRLVYIFQLVWKAAPWILVLLTLISFLNGVLPVITAWIGALLINVLAEAYTASVSGAKISFGEIMGILSLEFACIFARGLISHANTLVTRISGEKVTNHVKVMMMEKAKTVDLQSYDKPDFYERLENAQREAGMRPIQIINATFTTISTIISMVSFIGILFAISAYAPFIILVLSLPSAWITYAYRKKSFNYVRHRSKDRRQLNYYSGLMTNKDLVKEIRLFGLSDTFTNRYNNIFSNYYKGLRKLYVREAGWNTAISLASAFVNCLLFLYVAKKVWQGALQVGDYSLYTGALNSIAVGVTSLIAATSTIYEGTLFIDNLICFMEEKPTILPLSSMPIKPKRHIPHKIEFRNVSFAYPGTDKYVIKDLSAVINPGDTVALIGINGAGKTTLIKLITRLYDPTEGEIFIDDINIKAYEPEALYKMFGIIFQDFGKYAVNVKENIAFGEIDKDLDFDRVELAAEQSNAKPFINRLPNGFDTPLMRYFEDNGIELSIGQWQKLSIARAFYSDSDILILDEPTASLDALAEQEIYDQFDKLRADKTTIFVSHRLSSATTADVIFVLDHGELKEKGNHQELMEAKGTYYKLFTTQAGRYISSNKKQASKQNQEK